MLKKEAEQKRHVLPTNYIQSINCKLRVLVEDNGIGIAEDQMERLFHRFEQAKLASSGEYGAGSGLGLSICASLAQALLGSVGVRSSVGKGSEFFVELPCVLRSVDNVSGEISSACSDGSEQMAVEHRSSPPSLEREGSCVPSRMSTPSHDEHRAVLVVEDNRVNQRILLKMLERAGVTTLASEDGDEAVNIYKERQKDIGLVLMDIRMPRMDGYEATKVIRTEEARLGLDKRGISLLLDALRSPKIIVIAVPIVALSGNSQEQDKREAEKAGMDDYLTKPYSRDDLERVLTQYGIKGNIS